jgi:ABC-2 type transport system ATP-binding protein
MTNPELTESVIKRLKLEPYRDVRSKNLSLGNKQRLGLAKAMFHNPQLLILDEPTNGLDPAGIVELRIMLKELSAQGVTIFISSHLLDEVSRIATRIGIVHGGKLVREISVGHLDSELVKKLVIISNDSDQCAKSLASLGHKVSAINNAEVRITGAQAIDDREHILMKLIQQGVSVSEFYVDSEDLESYFLRQINNSRN